MTAPAHTPDLTFLDADTDPRRARFGSSANTAVLDSDAVTVHLSDGIDAHVGPLRMHYLGRGEWQPDTGADDLGVSAIRIDGRPVERSSVRYGVLVDAVLHAVREGRGTMTRSFAGLTARRADLLDAVVRDAEVAQINALCERLR